MHKSLKATHPLRDKARFVRSPLTELSYALNLVHARDAVNGPLNAWVEQQAARLGTAFHDRLSAACDWPMIWISLVDTAPHASMDLDLPAALEALSDRPAAEFAHDIVSGLLHEPTRATAVLDGSLTLREAVNAAPRSKREWLVYVGLYPHREDGGAARMVRALRDRPDDFRGELLGLMQDYWASAFQATWMALEEPMERCMQRARERWASATPQGFADAYRLRVEIDDRKRQIGAIRGGARMAFEELGELWFMPSAFNTRHLWHARPHAGRRVAYFPYLDEALQRALVPEVPRPVREPELDPALVFKALGDSTRYAILLLLARSPRSMSELAKELGLSKPTISHHTYLLREAGLLTETSAGRATVLGVRRETLAALSAVTLEALDRQSSERLAAGHSGAATGT